MPNCNFIPVLPEATSSKSSLKQRHTLTVSVRVRMQAPNVDQNRADRGTVAVTCVVDRSGSMEGKPIELVKRSVDFVSSQLNSQDYFGIVSYANEVCSPHQCFVVTDWPQAVTDMRLMLCRGTSPRVVSSSQNEAQLLKSVAKLCRVDTYHLLLKGTCCLLASVVSAWRRVHCPSLLCAEPVLCGGR